MFYYYVPVATLGTRDPHAEKTQLLILKRSNAYRMGQAALEGVGTGCFGSTDQGLSLFGGGFTPVQ